MRSPDQPFYWLTRATVVRGGESRRLIAREGGNYFARVHGEMLLQICRDYSTLPPLSEITASQIRFFYDGLRAELEKHTAPGA